MRLSYEGVIRKVQTEEGQTFSISANWNEGIKVTGESLVEAQKKFSELLAENGISAGAVSYKMDLG